MSRPDLIHTQRAVGYRLRLPRPGDPRDRGEPGDADEPDDPRDCCEPGDADEPDDPGHGAIPVPASPDESQASPDES